MTPVNIKETLTKRLLLVNEIKYLFNEIATSIDKNYFLRNPVHQAIFDKLGMQRTGKNRRLINEVAFTQGYRKATIQGYNYFSRVN